MDAPPLISEHDSWISLDPLIGCPASCAYCYLHLTNHTGIAPIARTSPEELIEAAVAFLARRLQGLPLEETPPTPLCIGNYTDMLMTRSGRVFLMEYLRLHRRRLPDHPLCVVTKSALDERDVEALDEIGQRLLVFVSQSFLKEMQFGEVEAGPTSSAASTARTLQLLARSRNLVPLHFWRPLTVANVPTLESACTQLRIVKQGGALASVAIGLKGSNSWPIRDQRVSQLVGATPFKTGGEHLPEELLERVLKAANQIGQPVFRATSCAIALALGRSESLGMWCTGVRSKYCEPCLCPEDQRRRCESARRDFRPPSYDVLQRLASDLQRRPGDVQWDSATETIRFAGELSQEEHSRLTHLTGCRIAVETLVPTRAWLGAITEQHDATMMPDIPSRIFDSSDWLPAALRRGVDRLQGITGLATTLTTVTDERARAFSRYYHVRRIVKAAESILRIQQANGHVLDATRVAWLAWVHDLNRWPFAHNSERGHFRQGDNYADYFQHRNIELTAGQLADLRNLESKRSSALSAEGQIVLLADILGGFVEDVLLCIQGLDVSPNVVPATVARDLQLPLQSAEFRAQLLRTNSILFHEHDVEKFVARFDGINAECIARLLEVFNGQSAAEILESSVLSEMRRNVRGEFINRVLFSYNNEKVSKGALLRSELIEPMLTAEVAGLDWTAITETEFVDVAVSLGVLTSQTLSHLLPELDYMMKHEPNSSFRLTEGPASGARLA